MKTKALIVIAAIILFAVFSSAYIVDETEQVIITQFGEAMGTPKLEPGLYFKIPMIQHANYFAKNLLEWDGDPGQIQTLDKTFIWVDAFARWKIVDPLAFFQTVNNEIAAHARLDDIINSAIRNFVTSYPLIETVRKTNRELNIYEIGQDAVKEKSPLGEVKTGRQKIVRGILDQAQPKLSKFGIEVVDIKIKRLNYVEEVQQSVFRRMIAERKQIAEKFRSEGRGESSKIAGDKEKELKKITSGAYKTAQEIKGKADAEATRIYAEAYNKDPEFYSFINTLRIYKESLDKEAWLMLSTKSDFFKYLKKYSVQ